MKRYRIKLSGDGWGKTVKEDAEDIVELLHLIEEKYGVGSGVSATVDLFEAEETGCHIR